jgi:alpha-L-fucosidase
MSATATRSSVAPPPATVPAGTRCPTAGTSLVNDDAADIDYRGSWQVSRDRGLGDFRDDVHFTTSNGSLVSFSFSGRGISLVSETFSDEGRMDVYLDGKFQRTVDTTSETRRVQQVVFNVCGLQPGFHNIRAVKRSGNYMLVDRFDVTP